MECESPPPKVEQPIAEEETAATTNEANTDNDADNVYNRNRTYWNENQQFEEQHNDIAQPSASVEEQTTQDYSTIGHRIDIDAMFQSAQTSEVRYTRILYFTS